MAGRVDKPTLALLGNWSSKAIEAYLAANGAESATKAVPLDVVWETSCTAAVGRRIRGRRPDSRL